MSDSVGSAPATDPTIDPTTDMMMMIESITSATTDNNNEDDDIDPLLPHASLGASTVDEYLSKSRELFPFMFIDFAVPDTHPNGG